jgi:alpha-galactosidase
MYGMKSKTRNTTWALLALLASLLMSATPAMAQTPAIDPNRMPAHLDPNRTANGLALTPPMGWNSWNRFGCNVNEATVRSVAEAMVSSGMRDAGYQYVVIDDCWHGARDAEGNITADPARFPSGMRALSDYVHSLGLKFGLYSDAGRTTCGGRPGSQGHEYQDARTYAAWGVDYLKYDWCATGTRNAEEAYALMADALRATGRPIVLSICEWGGSRPWEWAANIGNMWRTTGDIMDKWDGVDRWMHGVMDIVESNEPLWPHAGPGHWNDPDMLEVGNGGMTDSEYRAHFSLWAMMAAPLIAGNDIANMGPATREILTNREVIAVDQDALGRQGRRVWREGNSEVWVKPLSGGAQAVLLLNRGAAPVEIAATWAMLELAPTLRARVRDLWLHRDLPRATGSVRATVAPHGVAMLRVEG